MEESIFEQISEQTVSAYVNAVAVGIVVLALVWGAIMGKAKRLPQRCWRLAALWALLGPLLCLYWHLYDARTSYYDWLYLEKNPDTYQRLFWVGQPDQAARDRAEAAEAAGQKGVIIVEGRWRPARCWQLVQPYPLYSVRGLGMFALATLAAAVVVGLAARLALNRIDRKWPPPPAHEAVPPDSTDEAAPADGADETQGGDGQPEPE